LGAITLLKAIDETIPVVPDSVLIHCTLPQLPFMQSLGDTPHQYPNHPALGRDPSLNMIPYRAYKPGRVLENVLPHLGTVHDNTKLVPVPYGIESTIVAQVGRATNVEELHVLMRRASLEGNLAGRLGYVDWDGFASSDVLDRPEGALYYPGSTRVMGTNSDLISVTGYLDNEAGHAGNVAACIPLVGRGSAI
jgi:glyceraldehyde-3-phosphate dehydrogenase/erythrose-4-phosphate dehydrogenase